MSLQQYSDKLASLSEPIVQYCNSISIPVVNQALDASEAFWRQLIGETLGQSAWLATFDKWAKNGASPVGGRRCLRRARLLVSACVARGARRRCDDAISIEFR